MTQAQTQAQTPRPTTRGTHPPATGRIRGGGDRGHPVDETPPPFRTFTSGLQHVTAMYAGVVAPRMIVGCARQLWRSGAESHAPAPA
ncbi:hypothetical protein DDQ41_27265 [Streptomyces spongiicola]|uniref:Uncharacterized protein n=1 Tax=Streptomyces spongiicola TaxID=1690221 RepID=A0ABM6VDE4_9ACTN|nr:hypothetical protein DDQ41_27265 [Streptomyces spongiicola]